MSTKGGPVFTFSFLGGRLAPLLPPVRHATAISLSLLHYKIIQRKKSMSAVQIPEEFAI